MQRSEQLATDEYIRQVEEFNTALDLHDHTASEPSIPSLKTCLSRVQFLTEEVAELAHALGCGDLEKTLDALIDIQYFLSGTVIACGMQDVFVEAFQRVHRANMAKLGRDGRPIRDESGRVVKPEGWQPPDLSSLVEPEVWAGTYRDVRLGSDTGYLLVEVNRDGDPPADVYVLHALLEDLNELPLQGERVGCQLIDKERSLFRVRAI